MPDASRTTRLLFVTTADAEILAAAKATGLLPEGFPEVLCANPATLVDPGSFFDDALPGARAVLVRLLGGRRAWPEGFEELRRRCEEGGVPLLAFGGGGGAPAGVTAPPTP